MVEVDTETCIGCGTCTVVCGEVFELGSDGKARVKDDADLNAPCIEEAAQSCPTGSIKI